MSKAPARRDLKEILTVSAWVFAGLFAGHLFLAAFGDRMHANWAEIGSIWGDH